jgi:undecaprenyl-diphosphatase
LGIIEAIILGIIQGLTEFLPVSSSGHLEIGKALLGDESVPEESLMMTVVLHFATALSTVVVFRQDILELLKGLFQFKWNESSQFAWKIVLSMIPAAAIGLFFNDQIEALFSKQIVLVGIMLIITGGLLYLADKAKHTQKKVGVMDAIIIGVAQAIAILPGISRSGATISTSVLLGIDRGRAARFSFLMVVPLIFGKMAKDLMDGAIAESSLALTPLIAGALAAFIAGVFACRWMIALVKKSQLKYFSYYCFAAGILSIVFG